MRYIGSNGFSTGGGGMNFGSGIGEIPQSAIAGLSGMSGEVAASGMLGGGFGQMGQSSFAPVGLGHAMALGQETAPTPEQIAQNAIEVEKSKLLQEAAAKKAKFRNIAIFGAVAIGAYLLWKSTGKDRRSEFSI